VFSIVFAPEFTKAQVHRFVDALKLFKIGHSWAGSTSIVAPYDLTESRPGTNFQHRIVRLSSGIEDTAYIIDDLQQAFTRAAND
jgi:cystathionine beta-lyase